MFNTARSSILLTRKFLLVSLPLPLHTIVPTNRKTSVPTSTMKSTVGITHDTARTCSPSPISRMSSSLVPMLAGSYLAQRRCLCQLSVLGLVGLKCASGSCAFSSSSSPWRLHWESLVVCTIGTSKMNGVPCGAGRGMTTRKRVSIDDLGSGYQYR